jgi:hypothetical protein
MIRDAGFEVDGNALADGSAFLDGPAGYRLRDASPGVLRPEVARS